MVKKIVAAWDWLHATPKRTWFGHGAQALVICQLAVWADLGYAAGAFATIVTFGHRELPGLIEAIYKKDKAKIKDGLMDFAFPLWGVVLYAALAALIG